VNIPATVSIIVATYGDRDTWDKLAQRAVGSVANQTVRPTELQRVHSDTESLHVVRNRGGMQSQSDFLIFLDADDCLHPNYVEAMLNGEGDVRYPSIERFYWNGKHDPPSMIRPGKTLLNYSHIIIGAMVRRELFLKVGGFDDWACWEDWHFWMKCWVAGASIKPCKAAIYQSHIRPNSRSQQKGNLKWVLPIRNQIEPLAKAAGLIP
jgi:glycosyltransferase involved in cell wall biosynthesis